MRTLGLVLAASVVACSRPGAVGREGRHKLAGVSSRTRADDVAEAREPPRSFALPIGFGYALTAGAEPSPDHPAGTVYIEGTPPGSPGVTLAEWDLATGETVRRTVLALDGRNDHSVLANAGGSLHLVHTGLDGRTYYFRLSPELKVLSKTLVYDLRGWDASAVASDGKVTVVVGPYWSPDGVAGSCFASTYDEHGKLLGHRSLDEDGASQRFASMAHDAAVIDGRVYILVDRLHVREYTSDLAPITSTVIPPPRDDDAPWVVQGLALRARGARLVVEVPPAQYELSPDLADIEEGPRITRAAEDLGRANCGDYVHLGPVRATLCVALAPGDDVITWDHSDGGT